MRKFRSVWLDHGKLQGRVTELPEPAHNHFLAFPAQSLCLARLLIVISAELCGCKLKIGGLNARPGMRISLLLDWNGGEQ